ncbi:hypothetical protein [Stappia sp.]|uniref:hypothetical protein n=1 Tax=Stappia sp. TaxID=1870903 RepID=UPI003D1152EB
MTDVLFFRANGHSGFGVYGHVIGTDHTYLVTSIRGAENLTQLENSFSPAGNGFVFRGQNTDGFNDNLVYTDGSGATVLLTDANGNDLQDPAWFSSFAGETVFFAQTSSVPGVDGGNFALMTTNGGAAPEVVLPFAVNHYAMSGGELYVRAGNAGIYVVHPDLSYELVHDGTINGVIVQYMFDVGGTLYFRGSTNLSQNDFYRINPDTYAVTAMSIGANSGGDNVQSVTAAGTNIFYWQFVSGFGTELHVSDGSLGSGSLVLDIRPGSTGAWSSPQTVALGSGIVFNANDGSSDGEELWYSDGTALGTYVLSGTGTAIGALDFSNIVQMVVVGDQVFFEAFRGDVGFELFVTDGTEAGTRLVTDLVPGSTSANPTSFYSHGGYLYFVREGNDTIWRTDGTAAGTTLVSDPHPTEVSGTSSFLDIFDIDPALIPAPVHTGDELVNELTGSFLSEFFYGGGGADIIIALGGDDVIDGEDGDDTLDGGAGNDRIDGGAGTDTAIYLGHIDNAQVYFFGDISIVATLAEGIDLLVNVERVQFAESGTVDLDGFPLLDPYQYLASHADLLVAIGPNPNAAIEHFFVSGIAEGRAFDTFDEWSYVASHSDLITAFGNSAVPGAQHYVESGFSEGRARDSFDEWSYLASNTDLVTAFGGSTAPTAEHYVRYGFGEGRPLDAFDEWSYVASHSDLITAFGNSADPGARHYVESGFGEGRALDTFDEWSYVASHTDLITAFGNSAAPGARHYVESGFGEGRALDNFDEFRYIASNVDLLQIFGTDGAMGTQHYVEYGFGEGRSTTGFGVDQYLANYADLQSVFGSDYLGATIHYIEYGFTEGRTDDIIV